MLQVTPLVDLWTQFISCWSFQWKSLQWDYGKDAVKPLALILKDAYAGDYSSVRLSFMASRKRTGIAQKQAQFSKLNL